MTDPDYLAQRLTYLLSLTLLPNSPSYLRTKYSCAAPKYLLLPISNVRHFPTYLSTSPWSSCQTDVHTYLHTYLPCPPTYLLIYPRTSTSTHPHCHRTSSTPTSLGVSICVCACACVPPRERASVFVLPFPLFDTRATACTDVPVHIHIHIPQSASSFSIRIRICIASHLHPGRPCLARAATATAPAPGPAPPQYPNTSTGSISTPLKAKYFWGSHRHVSLSRVSRAIDNLGQYCIATCCITQPSQPAASAHEYSTMLSRPHSLAALPLQLAFLALPVADARSFPDPPLSVRPSFSPTTVTNV